MGKLAELTGRTASVENILALLEMRFSEPTDPGLGRRAELLVSNFSGLEGVAASSLYSSLVDKTRKDKLTLLFYGRLSHALTNRLLGILKTRVDQHRQVSKPVWSKLRMDRERETELHRLLLSSSPDALAPQTPGKTLEMMFPSSSSEIALPKAERIRNEELIRTKILEGFSVENSKIKSAVRAYRSQPHLVKLSPIPNSHEWNDINARLLFLRYSYEDDKGSLARPVDRQKIIEWVLFQEMAYEKARGIDYFEPFPSPGFSSKYGALNTPAKTQRDFRCATAHHPRTPLPPPEDVSPRQMFLMLLEAIHLSESQYYELSDQMRLEHFTDDEMNELFAHSWIYKLYVGINDPAVTLRTYKTDRLKEAALAIKRNARVGKLDPRLIQSSIFKASGNPIVIAAYKALQALRKAWYEVRGVVSLLIDFIPVVGQIKGLLEAAIGVDFIAGRDLEAWERALAILPGGIEHCGKIVKGLTQASRAAAKAARSPQLLVVLTLAARSGQSPVSIIDNMRAVASMSHDAISAAGAEIKALGGAKAKAIRTTAIQTQAVEEVRKAVQEIAQVKSSNLLLTSRARSVAKPVAIVGKHVLSIPETGIPDKSSRMVDGKITSDIPKPPHRESADLDALPANDRKPGKQGRQKSKRKREKTIRVKNATVALARLAVVGAKPVANSVKKRLSERELKDLLRLEADLAQLAKVKNVKLGALAGRKFAGITGAEAIKRLLNGKLSEFTALAQHWPHTLAKQYVEEVERLIIGRTARTKLAKQFHTAFHSGKVGRTLLDQLPAGVKKEVKKLIVKRWNNIRKKFWENVFDDKPLVAELKKLGITFPDRGRSAVLSIGDKKLKITLDHISRKVENPLEAFSPANLRALTSRDNSRLKEELVRDIKALSDLDLDAFQALGIHAERLPKDMADAFGEILDSMPNDDDLFRGWWLVDDVAKMNPS